MNELTCGATELQPNRRDDGVRASTAAQGCPQDILVDSGMSLYILLVSGRLIIDTEHHATARLMAWTAAMMKKMLVVMEG